MLGDVVETVLPGRSRQEIEQLLGPSLDWPAYKNTGRDLTYLLGPQRRVLSLKYEWLLIWLDRNGRFRRFEVAVK